MSHWPSSKAKNVNRAPLANRLDGHHLIKAVRTSNSGARVHKDFTWAFHDSDELGPKMLGRIAKNTGLKP